MGDIDSWLASHVVSLSVSRALSRLSALVYLSRRPLAPKNFPMEENFQAIDTLLSCPSARAVVSAVIMLSKRNRWNSLECFINLSSENKSIWWHIPTLSENINHIVRKILWVRPVGACFHLCDFTSHNVTISRNYDLVSCHFDFISCNNNIWDVGIALLLVIVTESQCVSLYLIIVTRIVTLWLYFL